MKSILKVTFFSILFFCSYMVKGQTNQTQSYSQLIIGSWVQEESPEIREVYFANGTQKMYIDNVLFETNYWQINTEQTQSGLTISSLTLTNVNDPNEKIVMEIGGINSQEMYLRSPNIPIRYVKQ